MGNGGVESAAIAQNAAMWNESSILSSTLDATGSYDRIFWIARSETQQDALREQQRNASLEAARMQRVSQEEANVRFSQESCDMHTIQARMRKNFEDAQRRREKREKELAAKSQVQALRTKVRQARRRQVHAAQETPAREEEHELEPEDNEEDDNADDEEEDDDAEEVVVEEEQ